MTEPLQGVLSLPGASPSQRVESSLGGRETAGKPPIRRSSSPGRGIRVYLGTLEAAEACLYACELDAALYADRDPERADAARTAAACIRRSLLAWRGQNPGVAT